MQYLNNPDDFEVKTTSFLQTLKESSARNHSLLDSNALLLSLTSPGITLHQYHSYLFLMQRVHHTYENLISGYATFLLPDCNTRKSSEVIAEDLKTTGYVPSLVMLKEFKFSIDPNIIGHLLGCIYVIEGSRLGGKFIFKNIQRVLGFSRTEGAKFVSDYGFETAQNWKNFVTRFSRYVLVNGIEEETIQGANNTFTSIYDFFQSNKQFYEV